MKKSTSKTGEEMVSVFLVARLGEQGKRNKLNGCKQQLIIRSFDT